MATELEQRLRTIVNERETKIKPENIKTGISVLGVDGTFTSDADALAENVELNKTAYVNGEKITGSLRTQGMVDVMVAPDNLVVGNERGWECISTTYTNTSKVIHDNGWTVHQHMKYEDLANVLEITPEMIVKDNSILGVEGTAEIGSDESNIKLFESQDEMIATTPDSEGTLGVVYYENYSDVETGMTLRQIVCFPDVTLDEAVTKSTNFYDKNRELTIRINTTSATISYYSNTTHQNSGISYTSTDGIHYIANGTEKAIFNFDTPIVIGTEYGTWQPMFNKFIQTGGKEFEGIFEYSNKKDNNWFNSIVSWNISGTTASTTNEQLYLPKLAECLKVNKDNLPLYNALIVYADGEYYYQESFNSHSNMWDDVNKKIYYGVRYSTTTQPSYNVYKLDLENKTYELVETLPYEFVMPTTSTNIGYTTLPYHNGRVITIYSSSSKYLSRYDGSTVTSSYYDVSNVVWGNTPVLTWHRAETQLTAELENQIAEGVTVLGASGVITGDGSIFNTINWVDYSNQYKNNSTTSILGIKDQHGMGIEILDEPTEESVMQNNYSARVLYNTPVLDVDFYNNRLHMLKHYWVRKIYDENYNYNCTIFDLNGNQVGYLEHLDSPEFIEIDDDTIGWLIYDYVNPTSTITAKTLKVSTGEITTIFSVGLDSTLETTSCIYLPEYGFLTTCIKSTLDTLYVTAANVNKTISFTKVASTNSNTANDGLYADANYIYVGLNGYINSTMDTFMVHVLDRNTLDLVGTISPKLGTGAFAYDKVNNRVYATFGNKMHLLNGTTIEETFDIPKAFGGKYSVIAGKIIWVNDERYLLGNGVTFKLGSQEFVETLNYSSQTNRTNSNIDNILVLSGDKVYICSPKPNIKLGSETTDICLESDSGKILSTHSTYMVMKGNALN